MTCSGLFKKQLASGLGLGFGFLFDGVFFSNLDSTWFLFQYVSEVVIGAPYAVTADLLDHFRVSPGTWLDMKMCVGSRSGAGQHRGARRECPAQSGTARLCRRVALLVSRLCLVGVVAEMSLSFGSCQ